MPKFTSFTWKSIFSLTFLFCFLLLVNISNCKYTILSSPVQLSYDQFNAIKQIKIRFMPEASLNKKDLLMLSFSQQMQSTPGSIGFSLMNEFEKQLASGTFNTITDIPDIANYNLQYYKNGASSSYVCDFSQSAWYLISSQIQSQWLTLILTIPQDLSVTLINQLGSLNMAIFSALDIDHLSYQYGNGLSYFYFASLTSSPPPQLISVQMSPAINALYGRAGEVISQIPGLIYPVYLQLTPSITYSDFKLNIEFTSMTLADLATKTVSPQVQDFRFQGTCYFVCQSSVTCISARSCIVKDDKIEVQIAQMIATQKYVLRVSVLNPPYQAAKNVMLWVDQIGVTEDMANIVSQLSTNPIGVSTDQLKLFWKIPYSTVVSSNMNLGFFVGGGINTVQVGFMINYFSPFGQLLEIDLYVGTTQLIMQSINHNLPSINTTISYVYTLTPSPYLKIRNITALTRVNSRYWISFRTKYDPADDIDKLGTLTITPTRYPTKTLFLPLAVDTFGTVNQRVKITYADFHDWGGFHTSFKNYDTQVLSAADNMLQNSTSQAIRKYFNQPSSVGVDPSIQNQQLLFLLKVLEPQMFSGAANQVYETKIFFNPNVFKSVSNKGLEVVAYNIPTLKWQTAGNDCYQDQTPLLFTTQNFMCQKYNDHVFNAQYDNKLVIQPTYEYYSFVCGNGNGDGMGNDQVVCMDVSCKEQCRLFKGYNLAQGQSGIASIRNVTFIDGYQSPLQAGDKSLDFIISFYHNNALVSSTLINAYTVKFEILSQTSVSLINTYHDGANYNLGDRIPTLIKISGRLTLSQYINLQYPDKMKIFLPQNSVKLNPFISGIDEIGCSFFCKINLSMSLGTSQNWLEMHSITVYDLPAMTNDFNIMIPLQTLTNLFSIYIGFESKGSLVSVYRFGGSAILNSITNPFTYIFQTQVHSNPWDLASGWTILPAYTYLQKINLDQTNSQDAFNLISMTGSLMPYHLSPYMTFSVRYLQILTQYTTITVGNSLQNRTCDKLNYFYNMMKIQAFVCSMWTNVSTTVNNIRIDYPIYQNNLGPMYPYDKVFAYAYASDTTGQLQGFKLENADKTVINKCKTNKATQYNMGQIGRQLEIYRVQIDPIILSSATYLKLQVILELPSNIQSVDCTIKQNIFNANLFCSVSYVANIHTVQISINPADKVQLLDFYIYLNVYEVPLGSVVLAPGQTYKVSVRLPHSNGGIQQIYGLTFLPFYSTAQSCTNSFTYINSAYDNSIIINSYQLNSIAIGLNSELTFTATFSKQKGDLITNSYVQIQFTNLDVNQHTYCYFTDFKHLFYKKSYTINSYKLYTGSDISDFTANPRQIQCSNLLLKSLTSTLLIKIYDVPAALYIMQSPLKSLIAVPYAATTSTSPATGVIAVPKMYKTLGFNSQYTINYALSGNGLVQGFIDLSQYSVDDRIVKCKLSIVQDVFCKVYEINSNSLVQKRSKFIYFKTYFNLPFTNIILSVYPIKQQKLITVPNIRTFIINNLNGFYIPTVDSLPTTLINDIILISYYNVIQSITAIKVGYILDIKYKLSVSLNRPLYIQIDQIFFINDLSSLVLKCTVDTTVVPCTAVQKDLIKVDISAYPHTLNTQYELKIQSFQANYQIKLYDPENFFIKMFIIDSVTGQVNYVSYLNQQSTQSQSIMTLINSYKNYQDKSYLIWNLKTADNQTYLPKVYVGYYSQPIQLITSDNSKLSQDFTLSSTAYTIRTFDCQMGYYQCYLPLTADIFTSVTLQYTFTHYAPTYWQPPNLLVQISNQKCVVTTQFTNYKIFQSGITLPIVLNFTHCRPRTPLTINPTFNSTQVSIESSLSQLQVTYQNPVGIIFVKHNSPITILKSYLLSLTLSGTYSSSFTISSSVTIDKITRTQSNVQAKTPQALAVTMNSAKIQIQCNQPSTVYWTIGFFPTTLGVFGQDIQTRLLNGQIGLRTSISDTLNYGNLQYGLTYADQANVWKQLNIANLIGKVLVISGNSTYSFKYFCMNIRGTFSDGRILTFSTPFSTYSFIKITVGFASSLTFTNQNDYACAISESLVIPYSQTITSVNTNCKNAPLVFYSAYNDLVQDYYGTYNGGKLFYYNFYIASKTESQFSIVSKLRSALRNNTRILTFAIPLWDSFNIQSTQPNLIDPIFSSSPEYKMTQTTIQAKFPISNQLSYVIVGLLSSEFSEQTMALPQPYLVKQGKFSQNVDFDQVYMNYTTGNITFNFQGLTPVTKYSIFYFVTVDDPRINSKNAEVKYYNLATIAYLSIQLFSNNLAASVIGALIFFCILPFE